VTATQVRQVASIGMPIRGVQMRVVDECGWEVPVGTTGELLVRGRHRRGLALQR
jgi:acyl-coenzyme A synthetase/AMP-(fatty) acid ligase